MSAETKAAVDAAIAAHVRDEAPEYGYLTDYYLIAASVGAAQDITHYMHVSTDAGTHVLMGLVDIGKLRLEAHHCHCRPDDNDD